MAVNPENFFNGDGSTTLFSFTFEYLEESDVKVSVDGVVKTQTTDYTFANATTISFNTAPASGTDNIRIYRDTNVDALKATFFPGSAIRAGDLNDNLTQNNYAVQEIKAYYWDNETDTIHSNETWVSSDTQIATTAAMDQRFQDEATETIESGETWVSDDDHIATTEALDNRFVDQLNNETIAGVKTFSSSPIVPTTPSGSTAATSKSYVDTEINDKIDAAITNDIGTDGTGITVTDDGDGTITLGLGSGSIDLDRIKADDIITYAEQPSVTTSDNNIFTASAAERQFDTIVQTTTPTGSDWEVGKTWLQNDEDKTVYIWNGTTWVAVASGGAFTELAKVVYVDAANGDDSLAGHRISNPKRTIKAAMDQINAETDAVGNGSLIIVAPGIYGEEFPITIEKNDVSIVGTSLRNCIIHPAIGVTAATAAVNGSEYRIRFVGTTDFTAIGAADNNVGTVFTATGAGTGTGTLEDTAVQAAYDVDVPEANELATMFQVNSGTYIQNLTLQGMKGDGTRGGNTLDTDATFGLPTDQGWNFAFFPGATIRKSPYIQNCTNFSDSQINNVNFTPHVPGEGAAGDLDSGFAGGGILIDGDTVDTNSPLRSMVCDSYTHTALNGPGIFVTNNGYTQVTSSYAFFTHYHLKCLNGGQANLAASTSDFGRYSLIADGRSTTNIFTADLTVNAADQATTFTIGEPTADASWHGNATRPQPNMLVQLNGVTYPILSSVANGLGWDVTISRPDPANRANNLGLNGAVNTPATAQFFLRSQIASSGHTMEYVGSGTDYRALPENATGTFPVGANDPVTADATAGNAPCGVPVEDRQTIVLNNGAIWTAVTDHNGKFRVGGDQNTDPTYEVDQQLGRVTFRTGSLSFPNLIQNLDTNGFNIFDSTGHVNINDELDVNSNKIVNVTDPTDAQDAATKNYVDTTTTANPIYVAVAGDTMSGELAMGSNKITGLGTPTANSDAATKLYVDSQVSVADKIEEGDSKVEVVDTGSNGTITFTTDNVPRATINADGRLLVGTTTSANDNIGGTGFANLVQILGAATGSGLKVGNTSAASRINIVRNESVGTGVELGTLSFGTETPTSVERARVSSFSETTGGSGGRGGNLRFYTAADGNANTEERMRISANGDVNVDSGTFFVDAVNNRVGIGITSVIHKVNVSNGTVTGLLHPDGTSNFGFGTYSNHPLVFYTNDSEKIRLDTSGRLLVGTTTQSNDSLITVEGNTGNNAGAGAISLQRGEPATSISGGESLGHIYFTDNGGNKFAEIAAWADATAGTSDYPGRIAFYTTADGNSNPLERFTIYNDGHAIFTHTSINARGQSEGVVRINGSNTGSGGGTSTTAYALHLAMNGGNATGWGANDTYGGLLVDGGAPNYVPINAIRALAVNGGTGQDKTAVYAKVTSGSSNTQQRGIYAEANSNGQTGLYGTMHAGYFKGTNNNAGTTAEVRSLFLDSPNWDGGRAMDVWDRHTTGNWRNLINFYRGSGQTYVGGIDTTTSSTRYNQSSDHRLKENVVDLDGAEARLRQIPVRRFNFIVDPDTTVDGFVAHEVQPFVPEAVSGTYNQTKIDSVVDENGNAVYDDNGEIVTHEVPVYQGIDQSKLVPLLTAALQEAFAKIDDLTARITALETP